MKFLRPLLRRISVGTLYLAKDITKGILETGGLSLAFLPSLSRERNIVKTITAYHENLDFTDVDDVYLV